MSFTSLILIVACLGSIDSLILGGKIVLDEVDFNRLNGTQWFGVAHGRNAPRILPEDVTCSVLVGFTASENYVRTISHNYFTSSVGNVSDFSSHQTKSVLLGPGLYRFDAEDEETLNYFGLHSQCEIERLPETDIRRLFFQGHVAYITDYQEYLVQIACHSFPDNCETWLYTPQSIPAASQVFTAQDQLWRLGVKSVFVGTECLNNTGFHG